MTLGDVIFLIKARIAHKRVGLSRRDGTAKIYDFRKKSKEERK